MAGGGRRSRPQPPGRLARCSPLGGVRGAAGGIPRAPLVGIDLIEPDRLRARLERTEGLDQALFHRGELAYCQRQTDPYQHLAARFAAKEAVIKALGIDGWDPLEIEIVGGGAQTSVRLHGDVAHRAATLRVEVRVSLSHLPAVAAAVAVATRIEPR